MPFRYCGFSGCHGRQAASGAGLGARLFHLGAARLWRCRGAFPSRALRPRQYLSLSLLRSALTIQAGRFVWAENEDRDVVRDSGAGGLTGIHPTKDGALYISVHSNHFFAALCELIGRPELARDPRCAAMRSRATHAAALVPELHAALALRSALEWEEIFGERVPCAAVRS